MHGRMGGHDWIDAVKDGFSTGGKNRMDSGQVGCRTG